MADETLSYGSINVQCAHMIVRGYLSDPSNARVSETRGSVSFVSFPSVEIL